MKTVLLTGFEPFNGAAINPAWEAVRALDGWEGPGFTVHTRQLPCVFGLSTRLLLDAIEECKPDLVIAVGQAGGRPDITVERIAINIDDAPIPDNDQWQPLDATIVAAGPAAYFATLPIKAMVQAMRDGGVAASVSQTAGTFVCNHVFYGLMHFTYGLPLQAGFIHVPFLPEQVLDKPGVAAMELAHIIDGLRAAVTAAVHGAGISARVGGATH
ncbi:pyroglutamyl-peptidase I [Massilia sp. S19_KUP03_FR1]|uniref:pyroglutamyl-peptidase I n=1 Tax=Massilia sp. S19_KUP03_FR1 TaxID=3025503 RepID=UPI002FCCE33B